MQRIMKMKTSKHVMVLGSGISGLSVADFLSLAGHKVTIFEKASEISGMCNSKTLTHKDEKFIMDRGAHKIYSQIPGIMTWFKQLLGDECLTINKSNSICLLNKMFEFPIKIPQMIRCISPLTLWTGLKVVLSFTCSLLTNFKKPKTYAEYLTKGFGKVGYRLIFGEYGDKVWSNADNLDVELAKRRIPISGIFNLISMILFSKSDKAQKQSCDYFYYPKHGFRVISDKLAERIKGNGGRIITNANVTKITKNHETGKVISINYTNEDGEDIIVPCDSLISTINIKHLIGLLKEKNEVDSEVITAMDNLKYRDLMLVHLIINKPKILKENWIFFPSKDFIFNRVSEQKSFSKYTCPKDRTLITAEITFDGKGDSYFKDNDTIIKSLVEEQLIKCGVLKEGEVEKSLIRTFRDIYPIYGLGYKQHLDILLNIVRNIPNLYTIGRPGTYCYNNIDACADVARLLAKHINENKSKEEWHALDEYFENYRIID